ncbi:hypothetical protein TWF281_006949 [Arthrobotrys megalospora]
MTLDRKGSRSSRRLQGAAPEPLSPPHSEGGDAPPDIRPRKANTQRVSIRDLTGLASPALSARDSARDEALSGRADGSDRRLTRRQASIVEEATAAIPPNTKLNNKTVPVAPKRRSERTSHVGTAAAIAESVAASPIPGGVNKRGRPSINKVVTPNAETKGLPAPLPLPARGFITKRRAVNPPIVPNDESVTKRNEVPRQTRASKRKAETAEDYNLATDYRVKEPAEPIQYRPPKRPKSESSASLGTPSGAKAADGPAKSINGPRDGSAKNVLVSQKVADPVPEKRKMTARKNSKLPQSPALKAPEKPLAIGKPAVWCDTRQELCESLPSFRSYQGGCYASKGFGRGYLIDGHASERDYMDASVIISHAGGNSEEVEGERRLVRDQTWDKGVIAYLRNNYEQMVPLTVIIGERCPTAPAHLEHRYSVMDWFKVTHCWPEKDSKSGNIRCKFRLEKLDSSERGWWAAAETPGVSEDMAIEYINCPGCRQNSPWIYDNEPMCLNKDCKRFWTVHSGRGGKAPERFVYRKSFLHGRTIWPDAATIPPGPLGPGLPIEDEVTESHGRDVKRKFWKGMWCQNCGKLNCRELWKSWKCTNCGWEFVPKRSHFVPADLSDQHRPEYTGPPIPENVIDQSIKSESMVLPDGRRAMIYHVYQCGKVIHILANKTWNALPGGSDWLLNHYQDVDMPFKRHELKTHKLTGRLLTQQFSFNSGAPYKYIVEVDSLPFEQSPEVVQQALGTLQADVTQMIPDALPMNEVLNVAYFEEQKMDFHDDGEEDLGPCVSSISLGSPAMMYFRVKAKYCNGTLSAADKALLQPSNSSRSGPSTPDESKRPSKRNILELRLHHGDVIIMNGRPIQRLLEHAVTPEGFRIAATARNISSYNAVINSKDFKTKRIGERQKLSITKNDTGKTNGINNEINSEIRTQTKGYEKDATSYAVTQATVSPADIQGRLDNHRPIGLSNDQKTAPGLQNPYQEQVNKHGLSNLVIPQSFTAVSTQNNYVGVYNSEAETPPEPGNTSPSVVAPSPTSVLSTPDFRYYNINAASATPIESIPRLDGICEHPDVDEESISPLTVTSASAGNYSLQSTSGRGLPSGFADPRTPMAKPGLIMAMGSPQIPGCGLPPQEFVGSELIDWRRHEAVRTPVPPQWPRFNWHGYRNQNPIPGRQFGAHPGEGNHAGELPGWSSEQVKKLQTMFFSENDQERMART